MCVPSPSEVALFNFAGENLFPAGTPRGRFAAGAADRHAKRRGAEEETGFRARAGPAGLAAGFFLGDFDLTQVGEAAAAQE